MIPTDAFLETAATISAIVLLVSMLIVILRAILGPSMADRVLALDLLTTLAIAFVAIVAVLYGQVVYLDVGIALALVGFLATVAFARFIARGGTENARKVEGDD
ncbi:MAG: cation:proton antiporter [Alphaproteobacteria bacterium]|nr:cation:proton antiporter [Alphaproteobacteria bacterium]